MREMKKETEEHKKESFNKILQAKGLFDTTQFTLPCFFIDNNMSYPFNFQDSAEEEKFAF